MNHSELRKLLPGVHYSRDLGDVLYFYLTGHSDLLHRLVPRIPRKPEETYERKIFKKGGLVIIPTYDSVIPAALKDSLWYSNDVGQLINFQRDCPKVGIIEETTDEHIWVKYLGSVTYNQNKRIVYPNSFTLQPHTRDRLLPISKDMLDVLTEYTNTNILTGTPFKNSILKNFIKKKFIDTYGEDRVDVTTQMGNYIQVIVHFPEITITNSIEVEYTVYDLYMKMTFGCYGELIDFAVTRTTYEDSEVLGGEPSEGYDFYTHSHATTGSPGHWKSWCFGNTDLARVRNKLMGGNLLMLSNFLWGINESFKWESLEGGPHYQITELENREERVLSPSRPYQISSYHNMFWTQDPFRDTHRLIFSLAEDKCVEFLKEEMKSDPDLAKLLIESSEMKSSDFDLKFTLDISSRNKILDILSDRFLEVLDVFVGENMRTIVTIADIPDSTLLEEIKNTLFHLYDRREGRTYINIAETNPPDPEEVASWIEGRQSQVVFKGNIILLTFNYSTLTETSDPKELLPKRLHESILNGALNKLSKEFAFNLIKKLETNEH